jgi:S1-C subfamily serine protease
MFNRLILFLVFNLVSNSLYAQQSLAELYKSLRSTVVVLRSIEINQQVEVSPSGELQLAKIQSSGQGSGFLVTDDLILTAAHVVHGVDELEVTFVDGETISAKVISSDVHADLSLVKLDEKHPHFKPAILADSDTVNIGDPMFVIGAPFDVSYTLTRGIISGRHKKGFEEKLYKAEFFQTDAALNPGNSGGPLFNMAGEVIGIASFIKSNSGSNIGLGFAVTSNSAKKLMLERPPFYSGIDYIFVSGLLAQALNIPQAGGLLIQGVAKNSTASHMGIKNGNIKINYHDTDILIGGDIILAIDGISTASKDNFVAIGKQLREPGKIDNFTITLLRQGKTKTMDWKSE